MWRLLFLILSIGLAVRSEGDGPLVHSELGALQGFFLRSAGGREIAAFTSIPFAQPPIGDLRFEAPVPASAWEGIWDATRKTPACVQRNPYVRQQEIVGQEDCLYLNVYTPKLNLPKEKAKLLPVMVFIHGGGLMCGDSSAFMYGPEYLLDRDVLLVTTNYRLGPLGYLSTQDELCPGNNGMKDQQEALRWIQKHIHHFGGDNSSVTIFGESAGGASAHYHMLSPTSAGLFHKVISESGTSVAPWVEASPGEPLTQAFKLAKYLDCPQAPTKKMLACLRKRDSYEIIDTEFRFYAWDYEPMTPFKVVVEPDLPGAFLPRENRQIMQAPSKVPWLTGLNKDEGCLKSVWITTNTSRFEEFMSGFDAIAPLSFYYENSPHTKEITKMIKQRYFSKDDDTNLKDAIKQLYSDSYFDFPLVEAVEAALKHTKSPVYLYQLAYRASNSFSQIFGDPEGDYGVCHADELQHLFPIYFLTNPVSQTDIKMRNIILTLWTNFATSGNPNEPIKLPFEWHPASDGQKMEHLVIADEPHMSTNLAERSRFWGTLPLWHKVNRRYTDEL